MLFSISISIFFIASAIILRQLLFSQMRTLNNNFYLMRKHNEELEDSLTTLKNKNKITEANFQRKLSLYEITKLISQSLDKKEVFSIFKKNISQLVDFKDCYLVEYSQNNSAAQNTVSFALTSEKGIIANLIVEALSAQDKNIMTILTAQLNLVLKKIALFDDIQQLSITDSLTQVFNRRYLLQRFSEEFKRSIRYKMDISVIMIDIDFFKACNDRFGHLVGDVVLREIANLIKEHIRVTDFLGRYGGEEFLVVLPDAAEDAVFIVAQRINSSAKEHIIHAYDEQIKVTISLGVATSTGDIIKTQELIDKADFALYRAKRTGRDKICIYGIYE